MTVLSQSKPSIDQIQKHVHDALSEDLGGYVNANLDITASLIPESVQAKASIITREPMVVCGVDWVLESCRAVDSNITVNLLCKDGETKPANTVLFELEGNARALLTAERTALNFLQLLSGTATLTYNYVQALDNSQTKLLDTRKTLPGLRLAQKYAVLCGGGSNHRIGLFDAFLIKENHIAACGGINKAVAQAKLTAPDKPVEVEVENMEELAEAIDAGADIIMLDNFDTEQVQRAVTFTDGRSKLEVSGNITLTRLRELAATGVDFISSGALTKNVEAIDLSMRLHLLMNTQS